MNLCALHVMQIYIATKAMHIFCHHTSTNCYKQALQLLKLELHLYVIIESFINCVGGPSTHNNCILRGQIKAKKCAVLVNSTQYAV